MSKTVAFLFSLVILMQSFNFDLEDISKLQALMDHAEYHQEMYGDNFFDFISEHYGDKMLEHQNKHREHQELPFKDSEHMCSHMNTNFLSPPTTFEIAYVEFTEIPCNFQYKEFFTTFEKASVFQPPKHA